MMARIVDYAIGEHVWVTVTFYGAETKGVITGPGEIDRYLDRQWYPVRITSRSNIGGYSCGEQTTAYITSLRKRAR